MMDCKNLINYEYTEKYEYCERESLWEQQFFESDIECDETINKYYFEVFLNRFTITILSNILLIISKNTYYYKIICLKIISSKNKSYIQFIELFTLFCFDNG